MKMHVLSNRFKNKRLLVIAEIRQHAIFFGKMKTLTEYQFSLQLLEDLGNILTVISYC